MADKDNKFTIRIESILGGHAPTTHFAAADQFMSSLGINPALPITDTTSTPTTLDFLASGLLRPVGVVNSTDTTVTDIPYWIKTNPKETNKYYIYGGTGSVYTMDIASVVTELGDLTDGGTASGNGAEYYDNYMYFARDTTIARYGPLDGTPAFTDDYWVGTLSKTALTQTTYPSHYFQSNIRFPNHVLHRHSDGRLYIADVVGNQGYIHYIATTKTTVEGDTDNGSTYQKLAFGYGLWPIALESYGSNLVIALFEGTSGTQYNTSKMKSKLAFWDTTSTNANQITWVEFPDELITGLKNVNGVLYITSASNRGIGFRVSRYIGGYTVEEIFYHEFGAVPLHGGLDGKAGWLVFGSATNFPETAATVYSYNLQKSKLSNGIFSIERGTKTISMITSLALQGAADFLRDMPVFGWTNGSAGGTNNGINSRSDSGYGNTPSVWWSQIYRIGQPFKITKIRIPLAQAVSTNMTVTPKIYVDGPSWGGAGTSYSLAAINTTNDDSQYNIVRRSGSAGEVVTGQHSFWLELRWTGSELCTVGLPITIEYELLDD
jgi:hypothetical protein